MTDENLVNIDRALQNAWLVYINGIEVPAVSVSVSYGIWQIPQADVTLVPDVSLRRLGAEDRVSVQIFYCDYWQTPEKPEFRLLFDGEIVAWSYVNRQRSRSINFTCIDYSQIFTQLFFFFMSSLDDIATGVSNGAIGVDINGVRTAGFSPLYPYSLFSQGLIGSDGTAAAPLITRPIDYIYNVILGLTDVQVPNKGIPASNFFAPWVQRTNFNRRFVALPYLESSQNPAIFPILRAAQADYAISAVSQMLSDIGSSGSIWQMFETILKTLMMELVMLPTAPAYLSALPELDIKGPAPDKTQGRDAITLGNYFVKPNMHFGLPPACNVFFPSMIETFRYDENYVTQPTRMYFNDETLLSLLGADKTTSPGLEAFIRDRTAVAHPEEVNAALRSQNNTGGVSTTNNKNLLVYPEEFYKGPVVDRRAMPRWFYYLAHAQSQQITAAAQNNREYSASNADIALYRKYAAYEFFKERYARRTGALTTSFNPYPVPAFPCVVFDRRSTQIDVFGYVASVSHILSNTGAQTTVTFSYGRTIQEVFDLLARQFAAENSKIDEDRTALYSEVFTPDFQQASDSTELIGAIAVAPPEVLTEVRDIVQNPTLAETFYRSLFFREKPETASYPSEEELGALLNRGSASIEAAANFSSAEPEEQYTRDLATENTAQVTRDLHSRKASFFYADHVDIVDPRGNATGVKIVGLDGRTRNDLITIIIPGLRGEGPGSVSTQQRDLLAEATNTDPALLYAINPENGLTESQISLLNRLEFTVRTASVEHNLRSDIQIVPKAASRDLFESTEAAMRFVARPICTLEEYINFLGTRGAREGLIKANTPAGADDTRSFPADYYLRIRNYRPGPPPTIMDADYGNTGIQSLPDGTTTVTIASANTEKNESIVVPSIPTDFPENRDNWDAIILAYRLNALEKLAPTT